MPGRATNLVRLIILAVAAATMLNKVGGDAGVVVGDIAGLALIVLSFVVVLRIPTPRLDRGRRGARRRRAQRRRNWWES